MNCTVQWFLLYSFLLSVLGANVDVGIMVVRALPSLPNSAAHVPSLVHDMLRKS